MAGNREHFMATITRPTGFSTVHHLEGHDARYTYHLDLKLFEGPDGPSRLEIVTHDAYGRSHGGVAVSYDLAGMRRSFAAIASPVIGVAYRFDDRLIDAIPPGQRRYINPRSMEFQPMERTIFH